MQFDGMKTVSWTDAIKRWLPSVLLGPAAYYLVATQGEYGYLDYFSLIIHEAGHATFRIFGEFIYFLGGTLMQLIIPFLLLVFFYVNYKVWGVQLSLFLMGQNLLNIAWYAGDARSQKIQLFGPPGAKHDWNWMLTHLNMLEYDADIALFCTVVAVILFIVVFFMPVIMKD